MDIMSEIEENKKAINAFFCIEFGLLIFIIFIFCLGICYTGIEIFLFIAIITILFGFCLILINEYLSHSRKIKSNIIISGVGLEITIIGILFLFLSIFLDNLDNIYSIIKAFFGFIITIILFVIISLLLKNEISKEKVNKKKRN